MFEETMRVTSPAAAEYGKNRQQEGDNQASPGYMRCRTMIW
jgi:hypothetical protein